MIAQIAGQEPRTEDYRAGLKISMSLSCWELPAERRGPIVDAFTLMDAIVAGANREGHAFADPRLLRRVAWWEDEWDGEKVNAWLGTLVGWGEIAIEPIGRNSYDPHSLFDVIVIQNKRRFKRWHPRPSFTAAQRVAVYARDGGACVYCGATESLSIDHIQPWSKGGAHEMSNFQTLCRPCNSRKGNRT